MAEETQLLEPGRAPRKRKLGKRQGRKQSNKTSKLMPSLQGQKKVKIDKKMKKLFRKRAREYNSDDEDDDDESSAPANMGTGSLASVTNENDEEEDKESEEPFENEEVGRQYVLKTTVGDNNSDFEDDEEDGDIQLGIAKFTEGCRAFKMAFRSIMKKSVSDDSLGPVLSGHKKLVVDKLAEEEAERRVKGEAKKEKQMIAEKGHVKPATYLDSHEKFLTSVATKGVVKLFNAVNKAQTAQKGLDSSRIKDAKEIRKRTKAAFFSELGKPSLPAGTSAKGHASTGKLKVEEPAWAPLRDNYMLTSSRLKDWDKMPHQDKNAADDIGKMSVDSSSDED